MSDQQVTVRIMGESYPLKTAESPAYVAEIAGFVDARMREISASGKVVATNKIAVLAALHIADELFRCRAAGSVEPATERIDRLAATLEATLGTSPPEA